MKQCYDLKVANLLAGIQCHASAHPCQYCDSKAPLEKNGNLRTLGELKTLSEKFARAKGKEKKASNFKNCVNAPLLLGQDSDTVLSLVPPPQLHIMLGICNKVIDELNGHFKNDEIYEWLNGCCQYHETCKKHQPPVECPGRRARRLA